MLNVTGMTNKLPSGKNNNGLSNYESVASMTNSSTNISPYSGISSAKIKINSALDVLDTHVDNFLNLISSNSHINLSNSNNEMVYNTRTMLIKSGNDTSMALDNLMTTVVDSKTELQQYSLPQNSTYASLLVNQFALTMMSLTLLFIQMGQTEVAIEGLQSNQFETLSNFCSDLQTFLTSLRALFEKLLNAGVAVQQGGGDNPPQRSTTEVVWNNSDMRNEISSDMANVSKDGKGVDDVYYNQDDFNNGTITLVFPVSDPDNPSDNAQIPDSILQLLQIQPNTSGVNANGDKITGYGFTLDDLKSLGSYWENSLNNVLYGGVSAPDDDFYSNTSKYSGQQTELNTLKGNSQTLQNQLSNISQQIQGVENEINSFTKFLQQVLSKLAQIMAKKR